MKKLFYKLIGYKPWRIVKWNSKYGSGYQILSNYLWVFTRAYDDDGFIWYRPEGKARYFYYNIERAQEAHKQLTKVKSKPKQFTYEEL